MLQWRAEIALSDGMTDIGNTVTYCQENVKIIMTEYRFRKKALTLP